MNSTWLKSKLQGWITLKVKILDELMLKVNMKIEYKRLTEVNKSEIIELMNNPQVRRQLPLMTGEFNEDSCEEFLLKKELLWKEYGYGPWAFIVDGKFAGWGGLQHENGDADLAMVLHPNFWGIGEILYNHIINYAFGQMRLNSVTLLLPPTRTRIQGLLRLGFTKETELKIGETHFIKYRLWRPEFCTIL